MTLTSPPAAATHHSHKPTTASACSPAATPTPKSAKPYVLEKIKTPAANGAPGPAQAAMPERFASSLRSEESS